jgi:hypothetical protein
VPLQNRVTPLGELIATPERGLVYGNRGCLHDEQGNIRRRYATRRWIACRLCFRGRRRAPLMAPGKFTELFFLDEATALAAGHRPCAECRRSDYNRFGELWSALHPGQIGADAIDVQLHAERLAHGNRERRFHEALYSDLPDGTFVREGAQPRVVLADRLLTWSPGGYSDARRRPRKGRATVITPPSLVAILRSGWSPSVPLLHPSSECRTP